MRSAAFVMQANDRESDKLMRRTVLHVSSQASVQAIANWIESGAQVKPVRQCRSEIKRALCSCWEGKQAQEECELSGKRASGRRHGPIERRDGGGAAQRI